MEQITLLNFTGDFDKAKTLLDAHTFHPWEGGEGKVPAQYQFSRVEMAKRLIANPTKENLAEAIRLLEECLVYPHNLGEGKLHGALENDFMYLLGKAHELNGDKDKAMECWKAGMIAPEEPTAALYYNDAAPDKLFYAGLCCMATGNYDKAKGRFNRLVVYGENHIFEDQKPDYFAVSLPDLLVWDGDLNETNRVHCLYMMALGHFGLGNYDKAEKFLTEAERINPNHVGILSSRSFFNLSEK